MRRPGSKISVLLVGLFIVPLFAGCAGDGEEKAGLLGWLEASAEASPWMIVVVLAVATANKEPSSGLVGVRLAHGISKRKLELAFATFLALMAVRFLISLAMSG